MTRTRAGKFRYTIAIQQATTAADATGQLVETWADLYQSLPMEILQSRPDNERTVGKEQKTTPVQQWRIRYREGITSAMRCVWNGSTWNLISATDPTGLKWELILEVTR